MLTPDRRQQPRACKAEQIIVLASAPSWAMHRVSIDARRRVTIPLRRLGYLARRFSCEGTHSCPCRGASDHGSHGPEPGWDAHRRPPALAAERKYVGLIQFRNSNALVPPLYQFQRCAPRPSLTTPTALEDCVRNHVKARNYPTMTPNGR